VLEFVNSTPPKSLDLCSKHTFKEFIMFTFNKTLTAAGFAVVAMAASVGTASAQEQGRVISSQPVIQQVAVPRQVCSNQQVVVEGQKSGAGGLMGAIAGGAIGSNVGSGSGRALASMIGFIGGAAMGDRIEGAPSAQMQTVQNCTTQTFYENRTAMYNVVYEFGGKQYSTQMQNDPGQFVQLQVTPMGGSQQQNMGQNMGIPAPVIQPAPQAVMQQAPVMVASPQVIYSQPQVVYAQPQVVYQRPYYPVVYPSVSIGFGYRGGFGHGHGHRRWH
jgi:uncharacterized protein YcfJ